VMLLTAGTLLVVGRVVPAVGDALALVLGVELLVAAGVRREDGPTVAGLLAGPDTLAHLLSWLLPAGLLVAGAALAVTWWHRRGQ